MIAPVSSNFHPSYTLTRSDPQGAPPNSEQAQNSASSQNAEHAHQLPQNPHSDQASAHNQQQQQQSEQELKQIEQLQHRDREVRTHEAAHKAAAGSLAGPIQLEYRAGPDGKRYAVEGEVSIDTSKVNGNPQATLAKAERIQAAAMAPAEPSHQDRAVASKAAAMAAQARKEIAEAEKNLRPTESPTTERNDPADDSTAEGKNMASNTRAVQAYQLVNAMR